jgi:hypothetical protein
MRDGARVQQVRFARMRGSTSGSKRAARSLAATLTAAGALAACAAEPAQGRVELSVWGGAHIEDAIPASVFADGWSVTFSRFLVTIDYNVRLDDPDGVAAFSPVDPSVFDLAAPTGGVGHTFGDRELAPGTYEGVAFDITQPRGGGSREHNAEDADIVELLRLRHTMRVVGTATRGAETFAFDWGFRIHNCVAAIVGPRVVAVGAKNEVVELIGGLRPKQRKV